MSMSDQSGPPTKDGVYDCLLDNGETVVLALESQAGTRTLRRPHARFEMCYLHEMEKLIVAHRPHTPPTPAPLKPLASDITQEQANELQDILRTLVPSGVALITSARELVKRYEAAKRYGETREATLAALQEKTEQALAAAEARAEEAEKERDAAFKQAADFQRNSYENYLDATGAGLEDALTAAEARIAELERELDQYSEWKCAEIARAKSREFALQADRAALAERIRGLKDKPCGMFTYKCIADFYHAGIDAAASLVEGQPQG
jgi:DNA-binding transcriptional regulator YbjK